MKTLRLILVVIISSLTIQNVQAQRGYAKDSLQIKVYTEITYKNSQVQSLKITKVFCDYCNETQIKLLKEEAGHRAYNERFSKENRLKNGLRKLALYIRIAKKDFLNLKDEN
jgi:hypothetical protein